MLWLTRRVASFLTDNQAGIRSFPGPRFRVVLAQSGGKWDQPDNLTDQTGLRIIALCRHSGDPASLAMVALASSGNRIPGKSRREDLRRDHRADGNPFRVEPPHHRGDSRNGTERFLSLRK